MKVPILDMSKQTASLRLDIDKAIARVINSGRYILGPEVEAFEEEFAQWNGSRYAIGVNSGTDALYLALKSLEIGDGDEVITIPTTAIPTISAIELTGATPTFVDIDPNTYCMNPEDLERRLTPNTKAVLPVHLYGQPSSMEDISDIAFMNDSYLVEDCAQSHGAIFKGKKTGNYGDLGCFSFYPSKNLGAFGDAGIITTSDPILAEELVSLRNYGQKERYHQVMSGKNSRLDEIQAAILRVKLPHLNEWNERRREIARKYSEGLEGIITPTEEREGMHVHHLYVIRTPERDELRDYLENEEIGTEIHYPIPAHLQQSYLGESKEGDFPESERAANEVLSLPMYPELTQDQIDYVIESVNSFKKC